MAKSGDYHDNDSVIDSDAVYQTFNSAKNSFLSVPSEERTMNPYVNVIGGNKGRPLSARGLPPPPTQSFIASSPGESLHPYVNFPPRPTEGSRSFSANSKLQPGQTSSGHDHPSPSPTSALGTQQYVSGLDPNSAFYRKSEKEREYEEIDEIAECIESDYYRKNMYPTKPQANNQSYQERPTISTSGSMQASTPASGAASGKGSIVQVPARPVPPKRNHGPSSRSSGADQNHASLPGMVDRNSFRDAPSLKDLMSANEAAKIQHHLESYQVRVDGQIRNELLHPGNKPWHQDPKPIQKNGKKPEWFHAQIPQPENEIEYVNVPIKQPVEVAKQSVVNVRPNTAYPSSQIQRPTAPPPPRPQSAKPATQKPPSTNPPSGKPQTVNAPHQNLLKAQEESQTVEISCEYQIPTVRVQSAKASKARSAMKNAIQKNSHNPVMNSDRGKSNADIEKKYSKFDQIGTIRDTFRRLKEKRRNAPDSSSNSDQVTQNQTNVQQTQNHEHETSVNHQRNVSNTNNNAKVETVSSFSSADSFNSSLYKQHPPKSGESLTSGEVSSLSSQAEMTADQLEHSGYASDPIAINKNVVVASAKIIDSGFETASISSAIGNHAYSCSCVDEKVNAPCTCQYTSPQKQNSETKTSWSNTDSVSSSLESETTLTQNVISCPDVVPQRLTPTNGPDVLGPDEQYPQKSEKSDRTEPQKTKNNKIFSKMHTTSIMNKKAQKKGVASKRYQELAKRGVPLRVSVVSAKQPSESSDTQTDWSEFDSNYEAEVIEEDPEFADEEEVYSDSDAQDFLDSLDSSSARSSVKAPARIGSFKSGSVVNEVIREVPEESSSTCDEESKGLLRPGEKLVKGFEISSSSASDQPPVAGAGWDEESKIDRMFTKSLTTNKPNSSKDPGMGLDETTIRQIVQNPATNRAQTLGYRPPVPVRKGLDTHHVKYCQEMASKCNLLEYDDLMPAHVDKFQVLRDKLQNEAKLGSVGVQLLDMIQKCWLNDCPPSTGQLVKQLRGPVTETEL
ncbi:hypothetical protein LOTGIDRAFT_166833 [Lottia gigantea]|uniref:Uncharacterized protein n=1 Tax=Lottia gigantea TaxID=225164 RepID=V4BDM0_LOTGI|nr:hypothetical protein LOTGIDRAFT_166833 [Lottia gigantea]ESO86829.1 hypothetical protein LOTGIDRAFT_166833 [Lottia gigantea]